VFICFVNHEYRILKDLWCGAMNTSFDQTSFVGLDFDDPAVDLESIASGYGARTAWLPDAAAVEREMKAAMNHAGPSFLFIERES
jgi:benzoylformate decarboxylase